MEDASRSSIKPGDTSPGTPPPDTTPPQPTQPPTDGVISKFLSRTAADDAPATDEAAAFRHGGWAPFRARVEAALRAHPKIAPRRVAAFCSCGSDAWVMGRVVNYAFPSVLNYKICSTKCHDRFCVPCSQERSYRVRSALLKHMHGRQDLKLVTLTLRASGDPLSTILDRLTKFFRLLRSRPLWKKAVTGGVSIIETKVGRGSGDWHCHFHVIVESKFIPQARLSAEWLRITGDSHIVDIRPVGARIGAVSYITKYITKAADHSIVMDPARLLEALTAFTGRRLVSTFGAWRGLKLMEKPDAPDFPKENGIPIGDTEWRPIGPLAAFLSAARAGDSPAAFVLWKLRGSQGPAPPKVRSLPAV